MSTWFTADWHLGHKNIIRLDGRPFLDVEEMAQTIFRNYSMMVGDGDVVYHLGDFALGSRKHWWWDVRSLPGYKILIPGNHDANWQNPRHDRRYLDAGFDLVLHTGMIQVSGYPALLSHLPTHGDNQRQERYVGERPKDVPVGVSVICGHVHNAWKHQQQNINVGVSVWDYLPVHADVVGGIIESSTP